MPVGGRSVGKSGHSNGFSGNGKKQIARLFTYFNCT